MERFDTLEEYIHDCWHLLSKAAVQRKGAYQTPVVGTLGREAARMRVVILREVDMPERKLTFFTDARSAKTEQLLQHNHLSWLFWDERKKVQIRMRGRGALHTEDELARKLWNRLPVEGRKNYATEKGPGMPLPISSDGLPDKWAAGISPAETEYAFPNFMVVVCTVEEVECLHLHQEGHQRARFSWEDGEWKGVWVVP